jgi:hypothetical protein
MFALTFLLFSVFAGVVLSMERGSFSFCTRELVSCLETKIAEKSAFKRGLGVLTCSAKTAVCDVETIWFALTDDMPPVEQDDLFSPERREGDGDGIFPDVPEEAEETAERKENGPDLLEEMRRLRREREVFEKNQIEIRKQAAKSLKKTD